MAGPASPQPWHNVQSSTSASLSGCGGRSSGTSARDSTRAGRSLSPPASFRARPNITMFATFVLSSGAVLVSSRLSRMSKSARWRRGWG